MKEKIANNYWRLCLLLKSELNSKNKISVINSLTIPVPMYSFIEWRRS